MAARRRLCAFGGFLAILLQIFLPFGQSLTVIDGQGNASAFAPLIVCEIMGGGQAPSKDAPSPGLQFSCPICQLRFLGQNLLLSEAATTETLLLTAPVWRQAPTKDAPASEAATNSRPRAPPAYA